VRCYFGGGAGVNISRLRPGSGFGFGLGAFFASFRPLSLLPMRPSMTQMPLPEKPLPLDSYLLPVNLRKSELTEGIVLQANPAFHTIRKSGLRERSKPANNPAI
jgi:hypothetical protein